MNNNTEQFELSGPARIRALFHPRLIISLADAGKVVGLSYTRMFRRIQEGTLALPTRIGENGRRQVLVDDLASYLYPSYPDSVPAPLPPKKRGRPRKDAGQGGAK